MSGSGSDEEEDDDDDEEDSSSQTEGEEEGEEESGSGSGRSEQSAGKSVPLLWVISSCHVTQPDGFNTAAYSISEDVSEDEQSDDDFEDERENGNHIPAGGWTGVMFYWKYLCLFLIWEEDILMIQMSSGWTKL